MLVRQDKRRIVYASCALGHRWEARVEEGKRYVRRDAPNAERVAIWQDGLRRKVYLQRVLCPGECPSCRQRWTSYSDVQHG